MHYEDLVIRALKIVDESWVATLMSKNCGMFTYPVGDSSLTEQDLNDNNIFIGRALLGAVKDECLVAIEGFEYIKDRSRKR